jgi:sec-independent protein translocase protein TatB
MLDLSWGELVLIGMIALIVIGPKELPTVLRTIGQWMSRIRRMASEFQGQFQEAMREAEFADLKKQVDSIADPSQHLKDFNPLEDVQREIDTAFEDKPKPAPSSTSPSSPSSSSTTSVAGVSAPAATANAADPALSAADAPPAPPAEAFASASPPEADKSAAPPDLGGGRAA